MEYFLKLKKLNLEISDVKTEVREKQVSEDFTRKTTIIKLTGGGETGRGEDVIYEPEKHVYPELNLDGEYSFEEFSEKLDEINLFPEELDHSETDQNYRRWAFESAALDLALKQNNLNLAEALELEYNPVRFVVSPSMNKPDIDRLNELTELNPEIEFKLDASEQWTEGFVEKLSEMNRVKVVDLKGLYKKENVRMEPNPEIYRLVAEHLDALLEDPKLNEETNKVLRDYRERITWDKPITGVDSVRELSFEPDVINIKPSRFGTVKSLLNTIEYCQENGIDMYGGGQFELDVGRQHIHAIASLFYPESPNDVAPTVYNQDQVPENPPRSPLKPENKLEGLEWRYLN